LDILINTGWDINSNPRAKISVGELLEILIKNEQSSRFTIEIIAKFLNLANISNEFDELLLVEEPVLK